VLRPYYRYTPRDIGRLLFRQKRCRTFRTHMWADEIIAKIGLEQWHEYFSFCFVRNPWDKLVSQYYWHQYFNPRAINNFSDFVETRCQKFLNQNSRYIYELDGEIVVSRICRFENLMDEVRAIWEHLDLPYMDELPRAKTGKRPQEATRHSMFNPSDRDRVGEVFHKEIERFNYRF